MKSGKHVICLIFIMTITFCFGQKDLSSYKHLDGVFITSHWGDLNITGTSGPQGPFNIEAVFTDTSKTPQKINNYSRYLSFKVKENKLYIETRQPNGFESLDLNLNIPENILIEILLKKGGNILVSNFSNGVEINSLNGSVKLEDISKYALVNAANGEINASFDKIDKNMPISLVTLNGGITASIPENSKRDLRLISRKNGYIESDFSIDSDEPIVNLNIQKYASQPIINTAKINGGGSLLFLSTENGPISIKKSKSQ